MINRTHLIKLKPTKAQAVQLAKTAVTARYAYNWGLQRWNEMYKAGESCDAYKLSSMWTQERPDWATEVSGKAPRRSFMNLQGAFKAFWRHQCGRPNFHKKGHKDSFYVDNLAAKVYGNRIALPRMGRVKMTEHLRFSGKIVSYTVSRKADGWYVAIQVELQDHPTVVPNTTVGIDVGCYHWAATSDGTFLDSPKRLKHLQRELKRKQRLAARKERHSKNSRKAHDKVARLYQKISNVKQDVIHKFTTAVAKNHGTAVVETLDIKSMQGGDNKYVRKGVQKAAMGEVLRQLEYKCQHLVKVDKWTPTSKMCSNCGSINANLTLEDRSYHCPSCGHTIDRDTNAALNILNEGLKVITVGHTGSACGDV